MNCRIISRRGSVPAAAMWKAGGYISMKLYEEKYPTLHSEAYFNNRMAQYFDNFEIVYAKERKFPVKEGKKYRRRKEPIACLRAADLAELGNVVSSVPWTVRWISTPDRICISPWSVPGSCIRFRPGDFTGSWNCVICPCRRNIAALWDISESQGRQDGSNHLLTEYVRMGMPADAFCIYALELKRGVKIFPIWMRILI